MNATDLRQFLWSLAFVAALLVLSVVPWNVDQTTAHAQIRTVIAPKEEPDCAPRLVVLERHCWKESEEVDSGAECRFTLLNEGTGPVRLKSGRQDRLRATNVPSEVAPGELAFVTARCQGYSARGQKSWRGCLEIFTSDPRAPTVSLYAIERRASGE